MPEHLSHWKHHPRPKEPSFFAVVVLSAVLLLIIGFVAYLFVGGVGSSLLPRAQPRNGEPTSQIMVQDLGHKV